MEINIVLADKINARKTDLKFLLAFILGIISTIWKQLKIEDILVIFLLFCLVFYLVVVISYLMPSKIEKAKELKYFILLYCREDDIPSKSNFEYHNS
ncbi:hypothetical protein H1P_2860007 [Hyella patelloides LEGE 07179]|uniref:Uncharacterized protein n=1 Tax=Hyella patelloides LEGE 07179 TaxID=945734 RepID=A0A563VTR0_9CYAN|nr:hypothetical protein [Hyella patelloides]VEP14774.1 hypothetical protein H1P_2860007 [Hyella patelloides LEGE 07179]